VADDLLDLALGLHVLENLASDRAVDLHAVDKGGNGDETVCVDFLVKTVGLLLVESDGVLGLVLDCMNVALVQVRLAFSSGLDIEGRNVAVMGLCPILSQSEVEDLAPERRSQSSIFLSHHIPQLNLLPLSSCMRW